MIYRKAEEFDRTKEKAQNGMGTLKFYDLFTEEQLGGRATMCSFIDLEPGCSVGIHPHVDNAEIYVILKGEAVLTEDGVEYTMHPGDAEFCADGHTHGIQNRTDSTVTFLAVILPNR